MAGNGHRIDAQSDAKRASIRPENLERFENLWAPVKIQIRATEKGDRYFRWNGGNIVTQAVAEQFNENADMK